MAERAEIAILSGKLRLSLAGCCAAVALLFCSCQALPRQTNAAPAKQANNPVAQPSYQPRPVVAPNYPVQPAGFHGAGKCACQGGGCPCCGPGTVPAFAFSGAAVADLDQPWKPDGIKGPW